MGKKRDKANENIEILIGELIDARKEALGSGNCPYYNTNRPCEENGNDCYVQYYNKNEHSMSQK